MDDSIDSGNFSARGYLPLIQKDSVTLTDGLAVYVKARLPFVRDVTLENSADSYLRFQQAFSPSSSLCKVFDTISTNIDKVPSINSSANVFVFGDFNVYH